MLFHLVVLLSLSWPHLTGARVADPEDKSAALDQIATASENVARNGNFEDKEKEFRNQLITSIIDTTVHYENSNGFVPMVVSSTSRPSDRRDHPKPPNNATRSDSSTKRRNATVDNDQDGLENDPTYSTEARIFLNFPRLNGNNRRSFEYQARQNDFELLKVGNDTPAVANYPDFYEPGSAESGNEKTQPSSRHKGKGKKLENYTGNYGTITDNNDESSSYDRYYPRNSPRDEVKASQPEEKVLDNYHQQDVLKYDGHGQSEQNGLTGSFPRTDQQANDLAKSNANNYQESYDNVAAPSEHENHQRFSAPVVVAEPNYTFDQSPIMLDSTNDDYQTSRVIDSVNEEPSQHFTINNRDGRFRSDEDSRDASDEVDYSEYAERPRRVQKSRRRPSSSDGSKRLQKEHRGSMDDSLEYESQGKRHHSSRSKSHRQRVRGNSWMDDDRHRDENDSYEETKYNGRLLENRHKSQSSKFKPSNTWNQVSPNLEISHSSGIEIGQLEKPKFIVPVKVNLVPVANFDHATAMGNSQGFDVSNAVLQNIVSATPVSTVSSPTGVGQESKIRVSTPLPDIIVGQNSYQNSMQAMYPRITEQNKFETNLKPQYVSSTAAPVFAVTPIHNVQGTATPRPTYQMQQLPTGHMSGNMPQLIVPQPTHQTVPTLIQTPIQSGSDFNIQVNPHGMHGQNLVNHGNFQITSTPQTMPATKINLVTAESQNKKTLNSGSTANFLASATMAVGQNDQRQPLNSYYLQNTNAQQFAKPQMQANLYQHNVAPKTKTYIQTTHLLPAVLQPMPTLATFAASTPQLISEQQNAIHGGNFLLQPQDHGQQYVKMPHTGVDNGISTLRTIKLPSLTYPTMDSVGSHSNSNINTLSAYPGGSGMVENAHLPYVGTRSVEIVNPNIKPSPVDTAMINSFETMHYPTAVFTTPFPMFTTTSVVTSRPAVLSTTTDSFDDMKTFQSQDRPMFNPINFVPNMDLVKNQNALNSKLHANEPLQQSLNLVPLIPGGNFFKPSFAAQSELLSKPKLNTDLETYAEQMFKESLKTIYNSQKWNNDRKPGIHRQNVSETMDIAKLKKELQRLKASLSDSQRGKDHEGHYSETKTQTAELPNKKPDELLAALEQMLKKNHPTDSLHSHHGSGRPHRHRRPSDKDKFTFGSNSDFRDSKPVRDFMTPPQSGSHRTKGHFHDKPGKKRPMSGPSRYNNRNHFHGPRTYPKHTFSPKSGSMEAPSKNADSIHAESSQFENVHDSRRHRPEYKKGSVDSYPFTPSSIDKNGFLKGNDRHKGGKDNGINHPRMHNFLGLLMKNKQLPKGLAPNYFQGSDQLKQFFEDDKQRSQQFYDDTLREYFYKMSEGTKHPNLGHSGGPDTRRYYRQKGA